MEKIKLSKNELKRQKDALKRYLRYLPTLQLKKQQLQFELRRIESLIAERVEELKAQVAELKRWLAVWGDDFELDQVIQIKEIREGQNNIAGIDVPVFKEVVFGETLYDLFWTPLWIDKAVQVFKILAILQAERKILERQTAILNEELRVTSQRINLFEKIKIPETRENIRLIQIFLGDQQIAQVVRGKIAKNKLLRRAK